MSRLPPLNALRVFNAAARHLNFSLAAKELCVTHSAVSHQIRHLEDWMGCTLFVRHAGGVRLTDAGQSLQQTTQQAFGMLETRCIEIMTRREPARLGLGAPASFLANWLIPRIEKFENHHPDIALKLQTSTSIADLLNHNVDAIILAGSNWPAGVTAVPLFAETIGPVCAATLAEKITNPADIGHHAILNTSSRPGAWADWVKALKTNQTPNPASTRTASASISPTGRQFDHLGLMLEAAIAGLGIAIAPELLVTQELYRNRLHAPLGFVPSGAFFCLCYRKDDPENAQMTSLLAWLRDEAGLDVEVEAKTKA
ncbi:LysR substrate-binding domain-containing protein [Thalassospira marina]|uniref:Transcriptional regulator n=1 Tax=Thalassospira marina TaxID=2048283 RepID=A0ABN5FRF6_9PROT|nr:LysR substrate-binding domain-containing protein [Thalassospira marina]AUG54249.1 transcriptional regulator [Thalassospira marina]